MKLQKLQRILFFSTLILLPTNLAKHFEFDFAYISGTLVDYLIPTLYLTDILLVILFLLWGLEIIKNGVTFKNIEVFFKNRGNILLLLFLIFATPTVTTVNKWVAWISWLHLLEGVLLVFFIKSKIKQFLDFRFIVLASLIGILFESILATLQWINQGSVFGFLFFGEGVYTATSLGISRVQMDGQHFVRSYGTLPHPNVLGGYLALFMPWLLAEILFGKLSFGKRSVYTVVLFLSLLALFFTFGRVAWVAATFGLGSILLLYLLRRSLPRLLAFLISLSLLGEIYFLITGITKTVSWLLRYELLQISLRMFTANPLFGVGLNNFVVRIEGYGRLPVTYQFLQPVHNIFFLILSELGIVGLLIFLGLLFHVLKRVVSSRSNRLSYYILISIIQILILGSFDHYFITLQQGRLMLFLVIGLALRL